MKYCMRFFNLIALRNRLLCMIRHSLFQISPLSLLGLISMDIVFMKVFASWIFGLLKLLLDDVYIEETILKS